MQFGATILAYIVAGILKPIVMVFSFALVCRMYLEYRSNKETTRWLRIEDDQRRVFKIILFSLVLFVFSELFCAIETYVLMNSDCTFQLLHSITSATGIGVFAVAMYMLLNVQVIRFGTSRCVMRPVCHGCSYEGGAECQFAPIFILVSLFLVMVAVLPIFAPTTEMVANPVRFALQSEQANSWYEQTFLPWMMSVWPRYRPIGEAVYLPHWPQVLDYRVYPSISIALILSGLILFRRRELTSKSEGIYLIMFAAGLLGYTYYQLILQRGTNDVLIAALGHEIGELFFLVILAKLLKLFFQRQCKISST